MIKSTQKGTQNCPLVCTGHILKGNALFIIKSTVEVRLVDAPPMWTSTCCGHCFHGPSVVRTVQNVSTTVDSSPLWTLFARPSSVHIRGPSLYLKMGSNLSTSWYGSYLKKG